jgi:putative ABC transport system substrate-binding protein
LGIVASYARPGGNVTGFVYTAESPVRKQLEAAGELIRPLTRAGLLFNAPNPSNAVQRRYTEAAASALAITLVSLGVRRPDELEQAFQDFVRERAQVVLVPADLMFLTERRRVGSLALAHRLPLISTFREHAESDGLLSYGVSYRDNFRRVAVYADKVLKGANVAELPVELPSRTEMVINLKTAKTLGLNIPPSLLARADEVIE